MILSEFERLEGYDTELGWQTKSRLDILSAKGSRSEDGLANGSRTQSYPGVNKAEKQHSLLPSEIQLSHSDAFHSGNDNIEVRCRV